MNFFQFLLSPWKAMVMLLLLLMGAGSAHAAIFEVTNRNDSGAGSLRQAINDANNTPGDDSVSIAFMVGGGAGGVVLPFVGPITLTSGQLDIQSNISIQGRGANFVTVSGGNASRVFNVSRGITANISGLTIANGNAVGSSGGGISNTGTLTLSNSTLSGNSASIAGGGIDSSGTSTVSNCTLSGNSARVGGGIYNRSGTFTVSQSTLSGNTSTNTGSGAAVGGGGICNPIGSTLTLNNSTLSGNLASSRGGGIYNESTINLNNTIVAGNSANSGPDILGAAGGNYNLVQNLSDATLSGSNNITGVSPNLGALTTANGGPTATMALLPGSPALNAGDPSVTSGTDQRGGGFPRVKFGRMDVGAFESNGPLNESLVVTTLTDEDDTTSDPSVGSGTSLSEAIAFAATLTGTPTISFKSGLTGTISLTRGELVIRSNLIIQGPGAGVITVSGRNISRVFNIASGNVRIDGLTLSNGRTGGSGGGIYNNGTLTVSNSIVSGNSASYSGGGLNNNAGMLTVSNSTLAGNSSQYGGGVFNNFSGTVTVSNSTLSGNSASYSGGGFYNYGTLTVSNSTLSGNSATSFGGGIINNGTGTVSTSTVSGNSSPSGGGIYNGSTLTLGSTVFSKGSSGGNFNTGSTLISNGYNLSDDATGPTTGTGDRVNVPDLKLDTLKSNGGVTQTCALLTGSPAINAGDPAITSGTDQRGTGFPRVRGPRADVGAFEATYTPVESLVVTTLVDESDGNADPAYGTGTSLREALNYAGRKAGDDAITFKSGLTGTITLTRGELGIGSNVLIQGPGAQVISVSGGNLSRVFTVNAAITASIDGLTIRDGNVGAGNGGGFSARER